MGMGDDGGVPSVAMFTVFVGSSTQHGDQVRRGIGQRQMVELALSISLGPVTPCRSHIGESGVRDDRRFGGFGSGEAGLDAVGERAGVVHGWDAMLGDGEGITELSGIDCVQANVVAAAGQRHILTRPGRSVGDQ